MSTRHPRSPYDSVQGLVYFARMLDKIRLNAESPLPEAWAENLGSGFDGRCVRLLHVQYEDLKKRVLEGGTDEEILEWCYTHGRRLTEEEVDVWSNFMLKRGWRDDASERLAFRIKESGLEARDMEIVTMFDFIDIDEGRTPPDFSAWMPPRFAKG